jgi:hypothetical protein
VLWWTVVLSLIILYILVSLKRGPQFALALVIPLSWLFPAWLILPLLHTQNTIVGSGLDVKVAVGSTCLVLYCFMPGRNFPLKFVWSDYAAMGLFVTHLISDTKNDGWSWLIPLRAYAEWYLPYVAGRLAFQSKSTIASLWPYIAVAGILLSITAFIEAVSNINLFEQVFGIRPLEGTAYEYRRWGMRRAYGPTMNPIYNGMVQVFFLGWIAYAGVLAVRRQCSPWWTLAIFPVLLGIVGTGSRGPILAFALVFVGLIYFLIPKTRLMWAALAVGSIVASVVFAERLIQTLESWSGEDRRRLEVVIDGETKMLSNVRARVLLFEVNKIAFKRSGLLGFGTSATSGFPLNIPVGPVDAKTLRRVWTVENTYALLMLRFGYLGAGFFVALGCLTLWQYHKLVDLYDYDIVQHFCAAMGATAFAVMIAQATVWMPHEIGFPLLWTFGVSAGLTFADRENWLRSNPS